MARGLDSRFPIPTLCPKLLSGSKVDSDFHPSEADQMSTRNLWLKKLPPLVVAM